MGFIYADPPYYNSNCGHYGGYTKENYEGLLKVFENINGKFLLSSYPSDLLNEYKERNGWHQVAIKQSISAGNQRTSKKTRKIEVLTANYPI